MPRQTFNFDLANAIKKFDFDPTQAPTGKIVSVGDGIAWVEGMANVAMGEIVTFAQGIPGVALNLNQFNTGIVILGESSVLKTGDLVTSTGELLSIPVSDNYLGRVIDVMGQPIDGKGEITANTRYPLEKIAPGVMARESVNTPLQTGIKAVDSMIPIGRGQRQLIIGDRSTGKSSIALSTVINQKDQDVVCVYVAIGQKRAFVSQTVAFLDKYQALDNTIMVTATASDPAAQQYIAPYAGTAVAEYFLDQGRDVLIIYDDLTKHAWAYREISLLLRRPTGREAYPGDVFYLHSRLLERACKLNKAHGGGSITALPIIETQANDVSAYIPTNVISITDGQIYLEADLFNAGQRPAVNVGLSVSRVGSAAQVKPMKQVAGKLRMNLAQYRELAAFAQFSSDLDEKTKQQIERGQKVTQLLKQHWEQTLEVIDQVIVIWAGTAGFLDEIQLDKVQIWEQTFVQYMHQNHQKLLDQIMTKNLISDENFEQLEQATKQFNQLHQEWAEVRQT